jgi:tRNA pseudouridine55 synthase
MILLIVWKKFSLNNPISGMLNINKPKGITSHDVVARVRRLAGQRKVGHTGTLDPLATGVLLVCLGQATRLIEYLVNDSKQYRATIRFGLTTDTLDAEGRVIKRSDPSGLSEAHLRELLPTFLGEIEQIPPLFSALKRGGQPLYKRARAGEAVEIEPRRVTIHALTWVDWQPPDLTLDITCSSGTYIRSLARDLGEAAGVGAHLIELIRTASGRWQLAQAVPLERLEYEAAQGEPVWEKYLHPPDQAVVHLPQVTLSDEATLLVKQGRRVQLDIVPDAAPPCPLGLSLSPPKARKATPPMGGTQSEQNRRVGDASHLRLARAYTSSGGFLAILTLAEPNVKLWQPKKVFEIK